ncbi:hypothetical protein FKM82_022211 [Ascaphus truei]
MIKVKPTFSKECTLFSHSPPLFLTPPPLFFSSLLHILSTFPHPLPIHSFPHPPPLLFSPPSSPTYFLSLSLTPTSPRHQQSYLGVRRSQCCACPVTPQLPSSVSGSWTRLSALTGGEGGLL